MAVATVMNSTDKVEALVPEMQRAMSAISRFEPEILGECAGESFITVLTYT